PAARPPIPTRSTVRRVALDVLPPIVTRAIVKARKRSRNR
ncbi:class I SAM-dependent methyltransferase, partial [Streptomyces inhibens]